jgi:hypothetical protein
MAAFKKTKILFRETRLQSMTIALQKRIIAGLSGIFILAAGMPVTGFAAPRHHKSQSSAPVNNACVQTASDAFARSQGYSEINVMRRASAIAYMRSEAGQDNDIIAGIAMANNDTGADFDLLLMVSSLESKLGVHDAPLNASSSARGPFQYLPAPFMTLFNWFAADYADGVYARAAAQIGFDEKKNPSTADAGLTAEILALRSDPYVASYIKGVEVMKDVRPLLRAILGRDPNRADIYIAHILGLEQDKPLIHNLRHNPKAIAADVFPLEASKEDNHSLFYKGNKRLTIQQFYSQLGAKTTYTLNRFDRLVSQGLAAKSCLPPFKLVRPAPATIAIPDKLPLPGTVPLPRPSENMPMDPDAIRVPVPAPIPEVPLPNYRPQGLEPDFYRGS